MNYIDSNFLKNINLSSKNSHKGDNGRLTIIGGSKLFHGASLWALKIASRMVDMVYYSSVWENQKLTQYLKSNLHSFIFVPDGKEVEYIAQSDAVLIGPGMVRGDRKFTGTDENGSQVREKTIKLLQKFPQKKWIIDAGALQALTPQDFNKLNLEKAIITPHQKEFENLFSIKLSDIKFDEKQQKVSEMAKKYKLTILLKGKIDIITDQKKLILNKTGNEGMTKGGTGDVLAGLVSALSCTNDLFTATCIGAYISGLAGDELYKKVGPHFNADDLCDKVPEVLWKKIKSSS
jgi:hydroxyethylthiazole kinase-like uncharacterized protein yjeF